MDLYECAVGFLLAVLALYGLFSVADDVIMYFARKKK